MIGENKEMQAWRYFKLTSIVTLVFCTLICFVLIFMKKYVARIFTSEPVVLELLVKCLPIVALKYIPDSYQGYANGVIRALGK